MIYDASHDCHMTVTWPYNPQVPVGPPSEVEEIFDTISYAKGASVIRMLYNWVGKEVCRSCDSHMNRIVHWW